MATSKKWLVTIVGPTATGKSAMAVALARAWHTHILSADSRQFYQEMHIGTDVPTPTQLEAAPHHFIHSHSVEKPLTAGQYETAALECLKQLYRKHDLLLLVGGSGLYLQAVLEGLDPLPEVPNTVRKKVRSAYEQLGLNWLQQTVKKADPGYYREVDPHNPHRLLRALEVCRATGKPFSAFHTQHRQAAERPFTTLKIGLHRDRKVLYQRINARVDHMIEAGLLEEVKACYPHRHQPPLQTVGYGELFAYLDGEYPLSEAVRLIKRNTRRYAKRQLTWFRRDDNIRWFDADATDDVKQYVKQKTGIPYV